MASVVLARVWLNPVSDLLDGLSFPYSGVERSPSVSVDIRRRAGGNFRMVTTPGRQRAVKVSTGLISDVDAASLESLQGVLLGYRDASGYKFFGTFTDLSATMVGVNHRLWTASFTVAEVSYVETV